MKTILIDPSRCIQCCNCQNACKDEHVDNEWLPYSAKQGSGQFWIQIRERQLASGSRMRLERLPVPCQHCSDAPCEAAGGGAVYRRSDGYLIIDPVNAKGRSELVNACPYGAIYYNTELDLPQKCTMCAHLLDVGWERPRCVNACPTDALSFVDIDELVVENLYAPLERLHPEYNTMPSVAYVRLPKAFLAGAVYSPSEDACLKRVDLTLVGLATGNAYLTQSGQFGEFRIDNVEPGIYTLTLEKDGYDTKAISRLDIRQSLNVGDLRLIKTPV
jgi:Fe-S-cluster-containing dehydrogenase component